MKKKTLSLTLGLSATALAAILVLPAIAQESLLPEGFGNPAETPAPRPSPTPSATPTPTPAPANGTAPPPVAPTLGTTNVDAPADSGATLSVSDSGVVEGSVAVPNVILNGTVKGDILAHERVELGATARVTGNVYYALIEMEMGAEITGKLIHEPRRNAGSRQEPEIHPGATADSAS